MCLQPSPVPAPEIALGGNARILLDQALWLSLCRSVGLFPLLWTLVPALMWGKNSTSKDC